MKRQSLQGKDCGGNSKRKRDEKDLLILYINLYIFSWLISELFLIKNDEDQKLRLNKVYNKGKLRKFSSIEIVLKKH